MLLLDVIMLACFQYFDHISNFDDTTYKRVSQTALSVKLTPTYSP